MRCVCCRWETYVAPTSYSTGATVDASQWFDDYTTVANDIVNYTTVIGLPQQPACGIDSHLEADLIPHGYNCSEGW